MANQYDLLRERLFSDLEEIERNSEIQKTLSITLPNDSDETDYDEWLNGSMRFFNDNAEIFKSLGR